MNIFAMGRALLAATALTIVLGGSAAPAVAQTKTLKFGLFHPANHPIILGAQRFSKAVGERSNGELRINVFPAGQLGGTRALEDGVKLGIIDIGQSSAPSLGAIFETASLLAMPLLFRSDEHLRNVVRGEIGKAIEQDMIKSIGVRPIMTIFQPPSQMTSNKRVTRAADLKGLKMRVPEVPVWLAYWRYIGTNPTPIDFGELYTSLQSGVVDGQENPIVNIRSGKFYEVQKFLILTNHVRTLNWNLISMKTLESLSPRLQQILLEEAKIAEDWINETWWGQNDEAYRALVSAGMEVIEPDAASFVEASKGFPEAYLKDKPPALLATYQAIQKAQ